MPSMRTRRSSPGWKSASGCTSPQAPATNVRAVSREQTPSRPPTSKRTSDAVASTTFASATSPSAIGTLHGSGSTALRLNWATRFVRLMKMSCASIRSPSANAPSALGGVIHPMRSRGISPMIPSRATMTAMRSVRNTVTSYFEPTR